MTRLSIAPGILQGTFALGRLAHQLGLGDLSLYVDEIQRDVAFLQDLETQVAPVAEFTTKRFESVYDLRFYRIAFYALVRALRPATFVETGVMHGLSSAFILKAMARNGHGRLVSVDLPSYPETGPANTDGIGAVLPKGRQPGWSVPDALRARWDLHLGDSLALLPELLSQLGTVDVFCHDSDHRYEVMWGELQLGWGHLVPGGLLVCDNVDHCHAFFDFCHAIGQVPFVLPTPDTRRLESSRTGFVVKPV